MSDAGALAFFLFPLVGATAWGICALVAFLRCAQHRRWGRAAVGAVLALMAWAGGFAATVAMSEAHPNQIASGIVPLFNGIGVGFVASAVVLAVLAASTKPMPPRTDLGGE